MQKCGADAKHALSSRAGNGVGIAEMGSQGCNKQLSHGIAGILYDSGYTGLGL